ncbi:MAG TPA: HisA/HisF-related TIM barrel protein, partial [Puia sp.]
MRRVRVIPVLLLKKGGLVKSIRFKNFKYVGDPINAVRIFNEKEIDEKVILDIDAARERRG